MGLLLFSPRATVSGALLPTGSLRRAGATAFRPSSSSGNVEAATDTTSTTAAASVAKNRQEWRAGFGLGLDLSEEMRRDMMWRMLAFPAAAVAAEAVLLAVLNSGAGPAADAPAWAGKAGSAVLFTAGLVGSQYGFFSSRWDAAEEAAGGWELAVRHWSALSMARSSSVDEDDDDDVEEEDDEWEYYEDDEEEEDD